MKNSAECIPSYQALTSRINNEGHPLISSAVPQIHTFADICYLNRKENIWRQSSLMLMTFEVQSELRSNLLVSSTKIKSPCSAVQFAPYNALITFHFIE